MPLVGRALSLLSLLAEDLPPFNKTYLMAQITRGGGQTLDKYSEAELQLATQGTARKATPKGKKKDTGSPQLLLVSNTHSRTAKYIQCLAAGVPIVSSQWIIHSCVQVCYCGSYSYHFVLRGLYETDSLSRDLFIQIVLRELSEVILPGDSPVFPVLRLSSHNFHSLRVHSDVDHHQLRNW